MMEGYMEFYHFALFNVKELDWKESFLGVQASNYFSLIMVCVLSTVPFMLTFAYMKYISSWHSEHF